MDIIAMYVDSVEKSTNKEYSFANEEAKVLFCEKFLQEIKKMDAQKLAIHLSEAVYHKDKQAGCLTFVF